MSQLSQSTSVIGQNLFTTSSTQQHILGEKVTTPDGRVFRYVKAGATALVPGKLYQAPAEDTTNFQNLTVATNAVGDTTVTTSTTVTVTANQLAGGLLVFTSATTGAGYTYRIKSHPAATAAVVTFTLEDPIITATSGTVKIDVHPNPYDSVILNPTTATSTPVGVAIYPVTASQYGWVQTHGPIAVLADGALGVGNIVSASTGTAGAVKVIDSTSTTTIKPSIVGTAQTGVATGEYGLVHITID